MAEKINISTYWEIQKEFPLLDVRTPSEYFAGHIPGSISFPLFSNEERKIVGTIYKQESPEAALLRGLDIVGPRLSYFIKKAQKRAPKKKVAIHCWRGGKRSGSMAWLLETAGFEVKVLEGGYKAYRKHIRQELNKQKFPFLVLGGPTGSGKTKVLKILEELGEQVIDLEGLARHRGSAFGALGEKEQPSSEHFENILYEALRNMDFSRRIWLENESRNIGKIYLPEGFWLQKKAAPLINLIIPLEQRIAILVDEYATIAVDELKEAFHKIKKRIGGKQLKIAETALEMGDFATAVAVALKYYDKTYQFLLDQNENQLIHHLDYPFSDPKKIATNLLDFVHKNALNV